MNTPEIIAAVVGAVIGSALTGLFALIQRSYEEWRSFQEQIGQIRERFADPNKHGIEAIQKIYQEVVGDVIRAVCRVRPYVLETQRAELTRLLERFRAASADSNSGLIGNPPVPPDYKSCFPDPEKAKVYLTTLLDNMSRTQY
jgi:hypothetical protein